MTENSDHDSTVLCDKQSSAKSTRSPLFVKIPRLHVLKRLRSRPSSNRRRPGRIFPWGNKESYAQLIARAILAQPQQRIKLRDIYQWFVDNLPYFKHYDVRKAPLGWKNCIRHTLSKRRYFVRADNKLRSNDSWWMLDTSTGEAQNLIAVAKKKLKAPNVIPNHPLLLHQLDKESDPPANKISDALLNAPSLSTVKLEPGLEPSASDAIIEPNFTKNCAIPKQTVEDLLLVDIRQAMASFSGPAKQEDESPGTRKRIITRGSGCVHSEGYIEINKSELSQNWSNGLMNSVSLPFEFGPVHVKKSKTTGTQTGTTQDLCFLALVLETKQLFEIMENKHAHKIKLMQQLVSGTFVPDPETATVQQQCSSAAFDCKEAQTQTAPTLEAYLARELTNDYEIFNLMLEIDYDLLFLLIE